MRESVVFNEKWEDGLGRYADGSFDLLLADVPYGINVGKMAYLTEARSTVKQRNGSRLNPRRRNRGGASYEKSDWDSVVPGQDYFDEVRRVSKAQIIFGVDYVSWTGLGVGRICWDKGVADGVSFKGYERAYASMLQEEVRLELLWDGMRQAKSLSELMTQQGNKKLNERRIHPCHKPVLLYKKLILDYGFKGCRILDTHVGGGSSRIAAWELGCDYVGFEVDEKYWMTHEERWRVYRSQGMLFDF